MAGKTSPPLLPHETLARVWRVASTDGRVLLVVAGLFALLAAAVREAPATIAGVLAAGAGAAELHGANRLRDGSPRGLRWLIGSQLALLVVVLGYAIARLALFDPAQVERLITPELEAQVTAAGWTRADIVPLATLLNQIVYAVLIVATCCYQGGMAWYFHRRRHAIAQALGGREPAAAE